MSARNDGGPAFARAASQDPERFGNNQEFYPAYDGMTLRDYFAIHAPINAEMRPESATKLVGRIPPTEFLENIAYWNEVGAKLAYMYADAMLAAREAA